MTMFTSYKVYNSAIFLFKIIMFNITQHSSYITIA